MHPWPRTQRRLARTGLRERDRTTRLSAEPSARGRSRGGSQRDALRLSATGSIEIEGGERSPGAKAVADRVDVGERRRRVELPDSLDRPPESEVTAGQMSGRRRASIKTPRRNTVFARERPARRSASVSVASCSPASEA